MTLPFVRRCSRTFAALVLLAGISGVASAQVVSGTVSGSGTAHPLQGVLAALHDTAGVRVAGTLTDARGRYALRAAPGTYTLLVEGLGVQTMRTGRFTIAAGEARVEDVQLREQPLELDAIAVRARKGTCTAFNALAPDVAILWDEVRKALEIAEWSASQRLRFRFVQSLREHYVGTGELLLDERVSTVRESRGAPWESVSAERLMRDGFAVARNDGFILYHAPDAATLLSRAFREAHCFGVAVHEKDALIGIRFSPRQRRSGVTGIEGVIWLHRATARLESVDFTYVDPPFRGDADASGRVGFRRLPAGEWIIDDLTLMLPRTDTSSARPRSDRLVQSRHQIRIVEAMDAAGTSLFRSAVDAGVDGADSGSVGSIAADSAAADSAGADSADADSAGAHYVGADAVGADVLMLPISEGGTIPARIHAGQRCGPTRDGRMHVIGSITDRRGRYLSADFELRIGSPAEYVLYTARSDGYGIFYFCNVSGAGALQLRASANSYEEGRIDGFARPGDVLTFRLVMEETTR